MNKCESCDRKDYCKMYEDAMKFYADVMAFGCKHFKPKQTKTNGDSIRAMSDEKLAEWITHKTEGNGFDGYEDHVNSWLDWLKAEVEA